MVNCPLVHIELVCKANIQLQQLHPNLTHSSFTAQSKTEIKKDISIVGLPQCSTKPSCVNDTVVWFKQ